MAYRTARTARDMAQAQAARTTSTSPSSSSRRLPERADHEISDAQIIGLAALFLGLIWAIGTLRAPPFSTAAEAAP
jgi:hypothetical protein